MHSSNCEAAAGSTCSSGSGAPFRAVLGAHLRLLCLAALSAHQNIAPLGKVTLLLGRRYTGMPDLGYRLLPRASRRDISWQLTSTGAQHAKESCLLVDLDCSLCTTMGC